MQNTEGHECECEWLRGKGQKYKPLKRINNKLHRVKNVFLKINYPKLKMSLIR